MNRACVVWMIVFLLAAGIAQAQDPAERSITNTVVSIEVTPPAAPPSGWAFWVVKETLPESLTPSNFSGPNPMWDATTHTITWSSVAIAPATLGYEVTGECDTRTVAGDSMFVNLLAEASSFTTTGDTLITGLDPDITPPVITLLGQEIEIYDVNDLYIEEGATSYDNCDGDLTAAITIDSSSVNTSFVGTFFVTYNVLDSSTNAAIEVVRHIDVIDGIYIGVDDVHVLSENAIEVEFSRFMGVGVDVPANYTVSGTGIGTLPIHPDSVSGAGNIWTLSWDNCSIMLSGGDITVAVDSSVEDIVGNPMSVFALSRTHRSGAIATPPVITLLGADPVVVECGSEYTDAGVTAIDQCGNDLTSSVVTVNPVDTSTPGVYFITYNVTDAGGNAAMKVTRTVGVVDTTPPVITLLGDPPCSTNIVVELYDTYVDAGALAYDTCDGDITASIVTVNPVDVNTIGSYAVTYNVLDSSGNAAVEVIRTVNVGDGNYPYVYEVDVVSHNSVNVVFTKDMGICADIPTYYTTSGTGIGTLTPNPTSVTGSGNVWTLTWDGCPFMLAGGDITVTVNPDMADSGGWPIMPMGDYATDFGGAMATLPVITLLGDDPATVELGNPYIDAGATAVDQCSNDISASINMVDAVNTGILGAYTVTYNVADAAGNMADEVARTVNVIPQQPDVPAAGGLGLAVFVVVTALGGVAAFRRRR